MPWFGVVGILIMVFGTIYVVVQQAQRNAANDPQIQLALDAAAELKRGASPLIATSGQVDIEQSLSPFTIVYDRSGKVVSGSGYVRGNVPQAPKGMLEAARGKAYHAVTWRPTKGTRVAAITVAADKYYVLSGRSLAHTETSENTTLLLVAIGFGVSLILVAALFVLAQTTSD